MWEAAASKQLGKAAAEAVVVEADDGQGVGMVKGRAKGVLDVARLLHEAGVHEAVKMIDVIDLLRQILELIEDAGLRRG